MVAMAKPWKHPRTGIFYFRRAVPADVREKLGWEFKISLSTKDPREAKRRFIAEMEKSERAVEMARSDFQLSAKTARALAGKWLAQSLEEDERLRDIGEPPEELIYHDDAETPYSIHLDQLEAAHGRNDFESVVGEDARALVRSAGLSLQPDSTGYQELLRQVFWAKVKLYNVLSRRARGDWTQGNELDDYPQLGLLRNPSPQVTKSTGAAGEGTRLSDIFSAWKSERMPPPKTLAEFSKSIRRFIELHGDVPAINISRPMVRDFKDALLRCPVTLAGPLRDMALPALLKATEGTDSKTLTSGSVNKHLGSLAAVLRWAASNGYFDSDPSWSNPATGLKVQDRTQNGPKRLPYSADDLEIIFSFPIFVRGERPRGGAGDAAKWLPLLALYTGARVEELGQLLVSDIGKEADVSFIHINTLDEGKRLKTQTSHRKVPIHADLLRCGFLAYVKERSKTSNGQLFPELRPDKHGALTGNWSKWWGRYARSHGITDSRKVFHSFRHTFKTACRQAGLPKEIHDAITGHSSADVGDRYGEGYPVAVLARELEKVHYDGLDLARLYAADSGEKISDPV